MSNNLTISMTRSELNALVTNGLLESGIPVTDPNDIAGMLLDSTVMVTPEIADKINSYLEDVDTEIIINPKPEDLAEFFKAQSHEVAGDGVGVLVFLEEEETPISTSVLETSEAKAFHQEEYMEDLKRN